MIIICISFHLPKISGNDSGVQKNFRVLIFYKQKVSKQQKLQEQQKSINFFSGKYGKCLLVSYIQYITFLI